MIVWLNGAFGSGKTSLADELRRRRPDLLPYDPEMVGLLLRNIVDVPTGDFQDLRLWRSQVASLALGLTAEYDRPLLVPMTLVDPRYVAEIFGELERAGTALHHFFLKVPPEELARRIDARVTTPDDPARDEAVREWCRARIAPCVAAADTLPGDTVFLDGTRPTAALAEDVLARIGGPEVR